MPTRFTAVLFTAAISVLLVASAVDGPGFSFIDVPIWSLQDARHLIVALGGTFIRLLFFVGFIGVVAATGYRLLRKFGLRRGGALVISVLALALLTSICASLREGVNVGVWPFYFLLSVPAALAGLLTAWLVSKTYGRSRLLLGGLAMSIAGVVGLAALVWLLHQRHDLAVDPERVTSEDRVRLTKLVRDASPRNKSPTDVITLQLSDDDINKLMSWALSLGSGGLNARVSLNDDYVRVAASLQTPYDPGLFINVTGGGRFAIYEGDLELDVDRLRVGRLPIPAFLANWIGPAVYGLVERDHRVRPVLRQLHAVTVQQGELFAHYGGMDLPSNLRDDLLGALGEQEVLVTSFSQYMHTLRRAKSRMMGYPEGERFEVLVQSVFDAARTRVSRDGSDPQLEARLAVVSLGLALGHPRLSEVVTHLPMGFTEGLRLWSFAPTWGRSDWTRHFWVSAALVVLGDQGISTDAGRLKEEIDAGSGGSGFSFADLGADKAGVAFAEHVTASDTAALHAIMQLSRSASVVDYVPRLEDLPEGLTLTELQRDYGGVGGAQYARLEAEIDARIGQLYRQ